MRGGVDDLGLEEDAYYSVEEVWALMRVMKSLHRSGKFECIRNWFLVHYDLNTGLRVEELSELRHGDFFVELGKSYVVVRQGKGNKRRNVPVSEELRRDYVYYVDWKKACGLSTAKDSHVFTKRDGNKLTVRALQKLFTKCAGMAGLERKNIHCLRHTLITHLLDSGAPPRLVQKMVGHASIKTTQRYMGISKNKKRIKDSLSNLYCLYKGST
ncbi:MAG: hypothetical protein DRO96_01035 [Candidatus Aenigmatarchaeota archaeon]|nr:MAG: hypothetical protein DRO96_01035 [Candidatus Aenigmarchaeota archaeon]